MTLYRIRGAMEEDREDLSLVVRGKHFQIMLMDTRLREMRK